MKNLFRVAVLITLPLLAISACKKEEAAKPVAAPVIFIAGTNIPHR